MHAIKCTSVNVLLSNIISRGDSKSVLFGFAVLFNHMRYLHLPLCTVLSCRVNLHVPLLGAVPVERIYISMCVQILSDVQVGRWVNY